MNNIKVQREIIKNDKDKIDIGIAGNAANHKKYNDAYDAYLKDKDEDKARKEIGSLYGDGEKNSIDGKNYKDYYGEDFDKKYSKKK